MGSSNKAFFTVISGKWLQGYTITGQSVKYLEVIFDGNLSWKDNLVKISKKAMTALYTQ